MSKMRKVSYIMVVLLFLPACGGNQVHDIQKDQESTDRSSKILIDKLKQVLPTGWKIVKVEPCERLWGWQGTAGEKAGLRIRAHQPGVNLESRGHEYNPFVDLFLMPLDWEGWNNDSQYTSVKGGKLIKYKTMLSKNGQGYPARFLGRSKDYLVFCSIAGYGEWKDPHNDIAKTLDVNLEVEDANILCGSRLSIEKAVGEADLIIRGKALDRPDGRQDEYGIILWCGKFQVISLLKGHMAGEVIEVHYKCMEVSLHEGYIDKEEEVILFVKEVRGNTPYLKAIKILFATEETVERVENLLTKPSSSGKNE